MSRNYHRRQCPPLTDPTIILVIAEYKKHVDQTLIQECLKRTVEERIRALEEFEEFREELRAAVKAQIDEVR
jgi:hypothetical protein